MVAVQRINYFRYDFVKQQVAAMDKTVKEWREVNPRPSIYNTIQCNYFRGGRMRWRGLELKNYHFNFDEIHCNASIV